MPSVATLTAAAVLLSAAGTMVSPAAGALLADTLTPERRRTPFSPFRWAVNIGSAVAWRGTGCWAAAACDHRRWSTSATRLPASRAWNTLQALRADER